MRIFYAAVPVFAYFVVLSHGNKNGVTEYGKVSDYSYQDNYVSLTASNLQIGAINNLTYLTTPFNYTGKSNGIPFGHIFCQFLSKWEPPEDFYKEYPYYLSGFDDGNSPIWVIEIGKWDCRKAIENGREKEMRLYLQQFLLRAVESMSMRSTEENPVNSLNAIIDLEGYGSRQSSSSKTLAVTLWFSSQIEQAWRDKLKTCYFVNMNYVSTTVWSLMKPLLGANVHKVEVFGTNRSRWLPTIVRSFPKSEIPEWYGGLASHKPLKIYGK